MNSGPPERPRILVAGVGNIFLGDDAFGVEVAQRLMRRPLPEAVRVVDFGIRGLDLAYALLDGYEMVILLDAAPRGGPPGTLYILEAEPDPTAPTAEEGPPVETHNMDPVRALRMVGALGGEVPPLLVVGCEPHRLDGEDDTLPEMTAAVRRAVDQAVPLVESLVERLLRGGSTAGAGDATFHNVDPTWEKERGTCQAQERTA